MREMREIPEQYRVVYNKAMGGKSRRAGIKAFCLECCGWSYSDVANCSDLGCPLYPYRPYKAETPPVNEGVLLAESTNSKIKVCGVNSYDRKNGK